MKTVILGDIHGRTIWKDIVNREDPDRVIFIGDYFDTHEDTTPADQLSNFLDICAFARNSDAEGSKKREVVMLVGNHDFHYWPGIDDCYSGYQYGLRASFEYALDQNKDLLRICYADDSGVVYSHAGFTNQFVKSILSDGLFDVGAVNTAWLGRPKDFGYNPSDRSGYGNDPCSSCLWVRPGALGRDPIDRVQVVGHTTVKQLGYDPGAQVYLIDCLGTSKEYLVRATVESDLESRAFVN